MDKIEEGVKLILSGIKEDFGLDIDDGNFKDTPKRVARSYREIFSGVKDTDNQIEKILESRFPSTGYDQMIICKGVKVYSMCPHHLMPVSYVIDVGYIPSEEGFVLGISKLARVIQVLACRPVLQETLTQDIGGVLNKVKPLGVAVCAKGEHYCMRMRGIRKEGVIITSFMSGVFRDDISTRQEFMDLARG